MQNKRTIRVAIVDYEAGNLFSVQQACKTVGLDPIITNNPEEVINADAIVLPGVGAFGDAMNNLRRLDLIHPLREFVLCYKPFLGICLGMQLLFSESEEFGYNKGLNFIEGTVKKFPSINKDNELIKVPQIGWNQIFSKSTKEKSWHGTPLEPIINGEFMYFVHSYYASPFNEEETLSITNYGGVEYCSAVIKDNIFATQFHPEKSAKEGIKIYQCWARIIKSRMEI
jgi:imidazole glycerol-phosphate synthase subunit HisH